MLLEIGYSTGLHCKISLLHGVRLAEAFLWPGPAPFHCAPALFAPLFLGSTLVWVWEATQTTRRGGFLADDRVYRARDVRCGIMSY